MDLTLKQWIYFVMGVIGLVVLVVLAIFAINTSSDVGDSKTILVNQVHAKRSDDCHSLVIGRRIAYLVDYVVSTRDEQPMILQQLRELPPLIKALNKC